MQNYHLRRSDKEITDYNEILTIIERQEYLTIALCCNNEPYLVSLNYGFDKASRCFYFHCADEGKKIDFLRTNPKIYGQILESLKYKEGECSYAYRSVQFDGIVSFLENNEEKKRALALMIEKIENPNLISRTKEKYITNSSVQKVCIGKIHINYFTGKEERL
jgi:nitroimidazol reductase NimA-like FMN-containing flavoprotein (pyridoxamine 5'-phosphate oxidase superfamily)